MDEATYTHPWLSKFGNRLRTDLLLQTHHTRCNSDCRGTAGTARSSTDEEDCAMGKRRMWAWCLAGAGFAAHAQALPPEPVVDTRAGSLIAVLRESAGANQQQETLQPYGTLQAQL